jgi:hypothetical protein
MNKEKLKNTNNDIEPSFFSFLKSSFVNTQEPMANFCQAVNDQNRGTGAYERWDEDNEETIPADQEEGGVDNPTEANDGVGQEYSPSGSDDDEYPPGRRARSNVTKCALERGLNAGQNAYMGNTSSGAKANYENEKAMYDIYYFETIHLIAGIVLSAYVLSRIGK